MERYLRVNMLGPCPHLVKKELTGPRTHKGWETLLYMKRENQQNATIRCLLLTSTSTCFGHHYAHLHGNKEPVTAFGVLFWFCWMWLVAIVGRCLEGSDHCEGFCSTSRTETFTVLTSWETAPHNRYQPHQTEPDQYTKCSNTVFVLLKMGIMMPETCWDRS